MHRVFSQLGGRRNRHDRPPRSPLTRLRGTTITAAAVLDLVGLGNDVNVDARRVLQQAQVLLGAARKVVDAEEVCEIDAERSDA
jgi:hypothetical protein